MSSVCCHVIFYHACITARKKQQKPSKLTTLAFTKTKRPVKQNGRLTKSSAQPFGLHTFLYKNQ